MVEKKNANESNTNVVLISAIVFVFLFASIICVSIDFGALQEVSQHPEYFYASKTIGFSMYPQVYTGDMFIIQTVDSPGFEVTIGDIIVFDSGHSNVGHRVLEIHQGHYVTKGDNNDGHEIVYPSQLIGRVYKTIYRTNPIGQFAFAQVAN